MTYRLLQSAFTAGEISPKAENRVDIDKYQYALVKAENALINPCGPVFKRQGMAYCAAAKYSDRGAILVPFASGGDVDYLLEIGDRYLRVYCQGEYLGVELATIFTSDELKSLRFTQSADVMFIASGTHPVQELTRYAHTSWQITSLDIETPYFDETLGSASASCTVKPSDTSGKITIQASEGIFTDGLAGAAIQITQDVDSDIVTLEVSKGGTATSDEVYVGEQWKIETSGTWSGTVTIQRARSTEDDDEYNSDDDDDDSDEDKDYTEWKDFRKYTSENNGNYTESGTVTTPCRLRVVAKSGSDSTGKLKITLTSVAYTHTGWAIIESVESETELTAYVEEKLGTTNATKNWAFSAWCGEFGYPRTVCFFQDRLVFGGTTAQPYTLWMSRTGDYSSFEVETASGGVLDDSAVCATFLSRNQYAITHLLPGTDLIVMTTGNEWIVSGDSVVTPNSITPRMQTSRGAGDAFPQLVGGRAVYVQRRGSVVRDFGYTYATDSYGGEDLTLLANHLVDGYTLVDVCYKQEPDSTLYFVRSDGAVCCLAYVPEQKVYAWSTIVTDGKCLAAATVAEGDYDIVYVLVERTVGGAAVRYIERMGETISTDNPNDYIMLDCAAKFESDLKTDTFSVPQLAGRTVDVLADGRVHKGCAVSSDGSITLPGKCSSAVIGLPFTMTLELPDVAVNVAGKTSQGLPCHIVSAALRLLNSLGGRLGLSPAAMDDIRYAEQLGADGVTLRSGDILMTMPLGGYSTVNKLCVESSDPYPFCLLSIVREVVISNG